MKKDLVPIDDVKERLGIVETEETKQMDYLMNALRTVKELQAAMVRVAPKDYLGEPCWCFGNDGPAFNRYHEKQCREATTALNRAREL